MQYFVCFVEVPLTPILYLCNVVPPLFPISSSLGLKACLDSEFFFLFFIFVVQSGEGIKQFHR